MSCATEGFSAMTRVLLMECFFWCQRATVWHQALLQSGSFGTYTPRRQAVKLGELVDEVEEGRMPLRSYRILHPEARLSPAEVKALVDWADAVRDELPEH